MIERQLNFQIEAAISFEQFWQLRTEMSESLREKMAGLSARSTTNDKASCCRCGAEILYRGKMSFPAEALIVSGRKAAV